MLKLLKCTCLSCFRFRMKGEAVEGYVRQLRLLYEGKLSEAMDVKTTKLHPDLEEEMGGAGAGGAIPPLADSSRWSCHPQWTSHTTAAFKEVVDAFLKANGPGARCENCSAHSPKLRLDGPHRIYREPLTHKARAANEVGVRGAACESEGKRGKGSQPVLKWRLLHKRPREDLERECCCEVKWNDAV